VRGRGRRAGKLRDTFGDAHGGAPCEDPAAQPGVAHGAGRYPIALGPDDDLARELLIRGNPLGVGVDGPLGHDLKPRLELIGAASPDFDPGRRHWLEPAGEVTAEHVLERFEPVSPRSEQGTDRRVGQVGELDLHGTAAGGEGPFDLIEGG
jgi:hypothetical protein